MFLRGRWLTMFELIICSVGDFSKRLPQLVFRCCESRWGKACFCRSPLLRRSCSVGGSPTRFRLLHFRHWHQTWYTPILSKSSFYKKHRAPCLVHSLSNVSTRCPSFENWTSFDSTVETRWGIWKKEVKSRKVSMQLSWAMIKIPVWDKLELNDGYHVFVIFTKGECRKLFSLMLRLEICCSIGMSIYSSIPGPICSAISSGKKSQRLFKKKLHFFLFSLNYLRQSFFVGIFLFLFGNTYFHSNRNSFNRRSLIFFKKLCCFYIVTGCSLCDSFHTGWMDLHEAATFKKLLFENSIW